jgi:hypothetical protein
MSKEESDFEPPEKIVDAPDEEIEGEYPESDYEEEGEDKVLLGLSKHQLMIYGIGAAVLLIVLIGGYSMMSASGGGQSSSHGVPGGYHSSAHERLAHRPGTRNPQGQNQPQQRAVNQHQPDAAHQAGSPMSTPGAIAQQQPPKSEESEKVEKLQHHVTLNGKALVSMHKSLDALSTRVGTLGASVEALKQVFETRAQQSPASASAEGSASAATTKDMKKLEKQVAALSAQLKHASARSASLTKKVKKLGARPVLPGWKLVAVTHRGAVLSGPGQIVEVVKAGQSFYGLKILKLAPDKGELVTSAGVLRVKG